MTRQWQPEEDATIREMREAKCAWPAIAQVMKISVPTIKMRYFEITGGKDFVKEHKVTRRQWTLTEDETILKGCLLGWTWQTIADELKCKRDAVIERGRRLNARQQPGAVHPHVAKGYWKNPVNAACLPVASEKPVCADDLEVVESDFRPALPAGHFLTWKAIAPDFDFPDMPRHLAAPEFHALRRHDTIAPFVVMHLCQS